MDKFEAGSRVILTDNIYIPTRQSPVWGSTYMCIGTIISITSVFANIQWDNGENSVHYILSLALHGEKKEVGPNQAFLLEKKRSMGW